MEFAEHAEAAEPEAGVIQIAGPFASCKAAVGPLLCQQELRVACAVLLRQFCNAVGQAERDFFEVRKHD